MAASGRTASVRVSIEVLPQHRRRQSILKPLKFLVFNVLGAAINVIEMWQHGFLHGCLPQPIVLKF
jgi:hypothetical protein